MSSSHTSVTLTLACTVAASLSSPDEDDDDEDDDDDEGEGCIVDDIINSCLPGLLFLLFLALSFFLVVDGIIIVFLPLSSTLSFSVSSSSSASDELINLF